MKDKNRLLGIGLDVLGVLALLAGWFSSHFEFEAGYNSAPGLWVTY